MFTFRSRRTRKRKERAASEKTAGGEIKDSRSECGLRNRRNSWKGYERGISNNVFLDHMPRVSVQQLV